MIYKVIIAALLLAGGFWYFQHQCSAILVAPASDALPAKYYICGKGRKDCFLQASYRTLDACEISLQRASWRCNIIDNPKKPDCIADHDDSVEAYCEEQ